MGFKAPKDRTLKVAEELVEGSLEPTELSGFAVWQRGQASRYRVGIEISTLKWPERGFMILKFRV